MATRSSTTPELRVAIVHDWLTNLGGAERVVLAMSEAFAAAPIYTSVYNVNTLPEFKHKNIITSYLQAWPLAKKYHQIYPLARMRAFESFDFSGYDVVLSSSSAEAKSIITSTETLHIAYIHTPIRYYWSGYEDYLAHPGLGLLNPIAKLILPRLIDRLRACDLASAQRPDILLANSKTVQARIKKYYQRDSIVLHPPVDLARFDVKKATIGDYYLVVSRLVPYKKVDVIVRAFAKSDRKLIIVGDGSQRSQLEGMATANIEFKGALSDKEVAELYLGAKAVVFAANEDFGITPVEAMACGKPVICFGKGGAAETVIDGVTGVYFDRQTPASLTHALGKFEQRKFDPRKIAERAQDFSKENFVEGLARVVNAKNQKSS